MMSDQVSNRGPKPSTQSLYFSGFASEGTALVAALGDVPADDCFGGFDADVAEQQLVEAGAELPGPAEQQPGTTGFGAPTPAMSEPRPSFCSVGASSFPLESRPFAD
jgi:hypothetical protein